MTLKPFEGMDELTSAALCRVAENYDLGGELIRAARFGSGNINDTFRVDSRAADGTVNEFIFQKVNTYVFTRPRDIMNNLYKVTSYVDTTFGEDSPESAMILRYLSCRDGKNFVDSEDGFWRVNRFLRAKSYDTVEDISILSGSGAAFGRFQEILSGMDTASLVETIPDFHHTGKRIIAFEKGVERNAAGRVDECRAEIDFIEKYKDEFSRISADCDKGILPLRVTHNDTKFNNILLDAVTGEPVRVIDLDTVMPGFAGYDFGDAIRFVANYAPEDEPDLSKVGLNLAYYDEFSKGYIGAAKKFLSKEEKDCMALSALTMTYELVTRFLLDYLDGDKYFKIRHPRHNIERTRCQMRLCEDMIAHYDEMCAIIDKYYC